MNLSISKPHPGLARASRRPSSEAGFALPTVILGVVAAFGLGTAMLVSSLSAMSGTTRDTNTKSAFAVAEAGVSEAIYRYNRFDTSDPTRPCLVEVAGGQVVLDETGPNADPPQPPGWCAPVTNSSSGGAFTYQVSPTETTMEIVSQGQFEGLDRRVEVQAQYTTEPGGGVTPFEDLQVIGKDGITINNGSSIDADVGTQGTLTITNGGKLYCDQIQAADTDAPRGEPCEVGAPSFDLPPVDSSLVQANNDNALLPGSCRTWNAATQSLTVNCATTIGASGQTQDFYLCQLTNNGTINIPAGATVNFWLGNPGCTASAPLVVSDGSKIKTASGGPPSTLAFLVGPSPTPTSIYLSAGGWGHWPEEDDNFIIYAPTTDVEMDKGQHMYGAIAANTIATASGGSFTHSSLSGTWELPGSSGGPVTRFVATRFVECLPTNPGGAPDAGC